MSTPRSDHVREVYTGQEGLFSTLQPGSLLIDSSTIEADVSKEMAMLAQERGSQYIDAPVSGGGPIIELVVMEYVCLPLL